MEYKLNLNGDKIDHYGPESDSNVGRHVARRQLKLKLGQKRN